MKTHLLFAALFLSLAATGEAREWMNQAGVKIQADLVEVKGGAGSEIAVLKMSNGQTYDVPAAQLSHTDQAYIQEFVKKSGPAAATETSGSASATASTAAFTPLLKGKLVALESRKLTKYEITEEPEFYAFYFSASWCGPCRAFTPDLVNFYRRSSDKKSKFEVVFVSSDKSEKEMADYMKDDRMPWPALSYEDRRSIPEVAKLAGRGIPCLVVVDRAGNVVSHSYKDGVFVGPRVVLEELKDKIKGKS